MVRYISRSGHQALSECPRKYYYNYVYQGTGFNSAAPAHDLIIGLAVHMGMEVLLKGGSLEDSNSAALAEYDKLTQRWVEVGDDPLLLTIIARNRELTEGLVRGWIRTRWAQFQERYTVESVEKEMQIPLAPNVVLLARCDGVLRDNLDGNLYVLNWKTTSKSGDWTSLWMYDIQMWTEALVTEHDMKEEVVGCIVAGLRKGYKKDGVFRSILTSGWTRVNVNGVEEFACVRPKKESPKAPSWKSFSTAEKHYPTGGIGLAGWVDWVPLQRLEDLFPFTPPIMKNNRVVEDWLSQVVRRETDAQYVLEEGSEEERLSYFYQNWGYACKWCSFKDVCTQRAPIEEMIKDGRLVEREEHHAPTLPV